MKISSSTLALSQNIGVKEKKMLYNFEIGLQKLGLSIYWPFPFPHDFLGVH